MPSITTWSRLEPHVDGAPLSDTLQARLYDPLWLLARQWQLGEFQGDDGGTPLAVRLQADCARLTRYRPGLPAPNSPPGQPYDPRTMPLETLVERETVRPDSQRDGLRLQLAAEAGQHFLRLLGKEPFGTRYHAAFITAFPLTPSSAGQLAGEGNEDLRFLQIMTGRVPDGRTLAKALRPAVLPAALGIDPAHQPAVRQVCIRFLQWYDGLFTEPPTGPDDRPTWLSERMEYAFTTAAPALGEEGTGTAETVLTACEYYGGTLDWYDLDVNPAMTIGAATDHSAGRNPLSIVRTVIPAPVTYRGMPAARWWEFEDSAVDFGQIEAEPEDLARLLLVEFAITYGNDWFVVPVDLPIGSLCRIQSLVVTDTFGVQTSIPSIEASTHPTASSWHMFRHSIDRSGAPISAAPPEKRPDFLFLAPTIMRNLEGRPLEEVLLLRDETANLAWGVERLTEGRSGRAVNRKEAFIAAHRQQPADRSDEAADRITWRLATEIPDYWIPFVPVQKKAGEAAIVFRRGSTLRPDGRQAQSARSHIFRPDPDEPLDLYEEELPREGLRISRGYQYTRWLGGLPFLWLGRRKQPGRGEGSSGLQFDVADKND